MDFRNGGHKIKLGLSTRTWEGTDLINPMDLIHTKNYRDPLNSRQLAAPGLFYDGSMGNFSWDFTYLAIQQKSKMPGTNSPWLPRHLYMPVEIPNTEVQIPNNMNYEYEDEIERDDALKNNVALRLQYIGTYLEVSVAGFEGSSTPPMLVPFIEGDVVDFTGDVTVIAAQPDIRIQPIYYRERSVAAATSLTLGSWIFRISANHRQPLGDAVDPSNPTWAQLGVAGIEKTFHINSQMLTFILQGVTSRRPDSSSLSLLSSLYEESYMLGIRYAPNEKWTWMQAFFQEQKQFSHFYHTNINWNFRDSWSLNLSASFFQGSPSSTIGNFSRNDQALLKASYAF